MGKYVLRFWDSSRSYEESKSFNCAKYVTIKFTPVKQRGAGPTITVFDNGRIMIPCDDYEIVKSETGYKWEDLLEFRFDRITLDVIPKEGSFTHSFPVPVEE